MLITIHKLLKFLFTRMKMKKKIKKKEKINKTINKRNQGLKNE